MKIKVYQSKYAYTYYGSVNEASWSDVAVCFSLGKAAHEETRCFIPSRWTGKGESFIQSLGMFAGVIFREIPIEGFNANIGWLIGPTRPCTPQEFADALEDAFQHGTDLSQYRTRTTVIFGDDSETGHGGLIALMSREHKKMQEP